MSKVVAVIGGSHAGKSSFVIVPVDWSDIEAAFKP